MVFNIELLTIFATSITLCFGRVHDVFLVIEFGVMPELFCYSDYREMSIIGFSTCNRGFFNNKNIS